MLKSKKIILKPVNPASDPIQQKGFMSDPIQQKGFDSDPIQQKGFISDPIQQKAKSDPIQQ